MRKEEIDYKGAKLCYQVFGDGKPVILLHGFGETNAIWAGIIKNLDGYCFLVPDIPGSGDSELLGFKDMVSIVDYADALLAYLYNEGISECTIIGHSMGGYIALAFAEKYPHLVVGLGLFHSSAFADDDKKIEVRNKAIEFIKVNGGKAFFKTSIPNLFTKDYLVNNPHIINQLMEQFYTVSMSCQSGDEEVLKRRQSIENNELYGNENKNNALIQYYQAMITRPDRTQVLKDSNYPILFIIGEFDNAIPLVTSLEQCHLPAISYTHILPVGHMGMLEAPEKCTEYIRNFLQLVNNQGN